MFLSDFSEFSIGESALNLSAKLNDKAHKRRKRGHDYVGNPYVAATANTGKWVAGGAALGALSYANKKRTLIKDVNGRRIARNMKPIGLGEALKSVPKDVPWAMRKTILPAAGLAAGVGGVYNLGKYYYNKKNKNKKS